MTRDSDVPTIFNPRGSNRNRTPSVLVTEEGVANGKLEENNNFDFKLTEMEFSGPSFGHSDSVGSQPESVEPLSPATPQGTSNGTANGTTTPASGVRGKLKSCSASFCSKSARKVSQH